MLSSREGGSEYVTTTARGSITPGRMPRSRKGQKCRSNTGQFWSEAEGAPHTGEMLVKYWPNTGKKLVEYRSISGRRPAALSRLKGTLVDCWSNTGQITGTSPGGSAPPNRPRCPVSRVADRRPWGRMAAAGRAHRPQSPSRGNVEARGRVSRGKDRPSILAENIADSEVLNEVSQTALILCL